MYLCAIGKFRFQLAHRKVSTRRFLFGVSLRYLGLSGILVYIRHTVGASAPSKYGDPPTDFTYRKAIRTVDLPHRPLQGRWKPPREINKEIRHLGSDGNVVYIDGRFLYFARAPPWLVLTTCVLIRPVFF